MIFLLLFKYPMDYDMKHVLYHYFSEIPFTFQPGVV